MSLSTVDLGKPTRRGVRHCPKCGVLNGTRGFVCKNKSCDMMFRKADKWDNVESAEDAVQIATETTVQLYSVKAKDNNYDIRGFVQLPLVQDMEGNLAENVDPIIIIQSARCYVESCSSTILTPAESALVACSHIRAAMMCLKVASCLHINYSILANLGIPEDIKTTIAQLAVEAEGTIVHRISRTCMVVRCEPTPSHPIGYMHVVFEMKKKEYRYRCACKSFKACRVQDDQLCLHFYCCMCAFICDEMLSNEFCNFITVKVPSELGDSSNLLKAIPRGTVDNLDNFGNEEMAAGLEVVIDELGHIAPSNSKRPRLDILPADDVSCTVDTLVQASSALMTLKASMSSPTTTALVQLQALNPLCSRSPAMPRNTPLMSPSKTALVAASKTQSQALTGKSVVEEGEVSVSFTDWLISVTERINQTMHYQFPGNPEPLVFHAPQKFFDYLQQRIASGNKKKRLPNHTTTFLRRDALPLGTFTKHTWHITNILHVKQIFDTPQMPLDITRSFVENRDGTFDLYEGHVVPPDHTKYGGHKQAPIRPLELKTYIKVGSTMPDQVEPTPLIIEWIPDILPRSHIGELRIKFEYGHQRNGHLENIVRPVGVSI